MGTSPDPTPVSKDSGTDERIILFARYPEPARVKTRLIPALGAEGACALHRQMVEYTIKQTDYLSGLQPLSVEVRYTGGNLALMEEWLGAGREYSTQSCGPLGVRMMTAFQEAFQAGFRRVVLIGSDCPGLTPAVLKKAFKALAGHDLVLGPARDGGYYLIGLGRSRPSLFMDIPWGSGEVCHKTLERAHRLGLKVFLLETLADIDRPEDLGLWKNAGS